MQESLLVEMRRQHLRRFNERIGTVLMPFGVHYGKRLLDVPRDYAIWLLGTLRTSHSLYPMLMHSVCPSADELCQIQSKTMEARRGAKKQKQNGKRKGQRRATPSERKSHNESVNRKQAFQSCEGEECPF